MKNVRTPLNRKLKPWRIRQARRVARISQMSFDELEAYSGFRIERLRFNTLFTLGRPMQKADRLAIRAAEARRKKAKQRSAARRAKLKADREAQP